MEGTKAKEYYSIPLPLNNRSPVLWFAKVVSTLKAGKLHVNANGIENGLKPSQETDVLEGYNDGAVFKFGHTTDIK